MRAMKRSYVGLMHRMGDLGPVMRLSEGSVRHDPYGWWRWAMSLFAIYDSRRMVKLSLPWWNVVATREVERFLESRNHPRVFEYGTGASTAWLASRAAEVFSVEHDTAFIGSFREMLKPFANVTLMERPIDPDPGAYVGAIGEAGGQFDMIVVDGRHRGECLEVAKAHLKSDGIVLFDDSGRKRYRAAIEQSGFVERHHFGRSFCVPYPDHTSILFRRD